MIRMSEINYKSQPLSNGCCEWATKHSTSLSFLSACCFFRWGTECRG